MLASFAACRSRAPAIASDDAGDSVHVDSSAGIIEPASQPYKATVVTAPATLSGAIQGGVGAVDASVPAEGDCPVDLRKGRTAEAAPSVVVWIDGLTSGKAPPRENRNDLVSAGCALQPRVQAVRTGGAINVFNDDRAIHRLIFLRMGTHDTLQVMPFANSGEVVATDRLTKVAGIVEVHCAQHPWTRGYIAVFDHPYFDVAQRGSTFEIDSLPAGEHALMTWEEGQPKPAVRSVMVVAPGTTITIP